MDAELTAEFAYLHGIQKRYGPYYTLDISRLQDLIKKRGGKVQGKTWTHDDIVKHFFSGHGSGVAAFSGHCKRR